MRNKPAHYFDMEQAPKDDMELHMCVRQGYVPSGCLLAGHIVWALVKTGKDPCKGCSGPRAKCGGRPAGDE